jgi:amicyanin
MLRHVTDAVARDVRRTSLREVTVNRPLLLPLAAAGAALALAACGGGSRPGSTPADPLTASASAPSAASPASAAPANPVATTSVAIVSFAFSPAVITVKAGSTVTWTNQDEDAHTVAITGQPVSGPLQNADAYTHTFAQAGTYSYHCTIHPFMRGTVVVTAG